MYDNIDIITQYVCIVTKEQVWMYLPRVAYSEFYCFLTNRIETGI